MFSRFSKTLVVIILISILMAIVVLPNSMKSNWSNSKFLSIFTKSKLKLGLDLQGGTQLNYKIDLRNAYAKNEDKDRDNDVNIRDIIEGVRTTIERRVNGLGVSEPQIYISNEGGESHIIVELAGIKDIDEAKAIVGKTIQLEFKEKKEKLDPNEEQVIRDEANKTLENLKADGADFVSVAKNVQTNDGKIEFRENQTKWDSELASYYKDIFPKLNDGQFYKDSVIEGSDGYTIGSDGKMTEKKGLYLVQLLSKEEKDHTKQKVDTFEDFAKNLGVSVEDLKNQKLEDLNTLDQAMVKNLKVSDISELVKDESGLRAYKLVKKNDKSEIQASHILISYKGATRADAKVTRTKEEAKTEAEKVLKEVNSNPDNFAELAKQYSDGPSATKGGDLGFFGKGMMAPAFENAAFALDVNQISNVVETEFGYHIIKVTDKRVADNLMDLQVIRMKNNEENLKKFSAALEKTKPYEVTVKEIEYKYNEIFFDLTPDMWKSTGLDGSHFKYATVSYDRIGNPLVNIYFDNEGAVMFGDITERLVNKPLAIFVGGELISAPNVNEKISGGSAVITGKYSIQEAMKLSNDLNTGAIDAPVILTGQHTISASLGDSALKTSIFAGILGLIILAIYMIIYYRLMGVFAVLALIIYSIILMFIVKFTGIVMTLAGIAGIILSIGMAVDANILIFERTKEELNLGKGMAGAINMGFERAWSSIRDSNISSLITCTILWFFGNSIIRGFALMLALGILISMFSAIIVTKQFLETVIGSKLTKCKWLFGVKKIESQNR